MKLAHAVSRNFPGLMESMVPSNRQLRDAAKKYGIERPPGGTYRDVPVLSTTNPRIHDAVVGFSRKLFLALYYKHSGVPLPPSGGIAIRWYTNVQIFAGEIPESLNDVMPGFPKLERARKNLSEQFFYRWGMAPGHEAAVFLCIFREAFGVVGYLRTDRQLLPEGSKVEIAEPFSPE
jgi:hypothetical protein